MRRAWNRIQIAVVGLFLVACMVVTIATLLPWRVGKGMIESAMDWVDYDVSSLGLSVSRVFKALKVGAAPNYSRVKK